MFWQEAFATAATLVADMDASLVADLQRNVLELKDVPDRIDDNDDDDDDEKMKE